MIYIIGWLVFGLLAALIGSQNEGDGGFGWFLIGVILGPIGLILAVFAKPKKGKRRKCPQCAELVKREAKVCKHCGNELEVIQRPAAPRKKGSATVRLLKMTGVILGGCVVLALVLWSFAG